MECPGRACRTRRARQGNRGGGQLPDRRACANPSPRLTRVGVSALNDMSFSRRQAIGALSAGVASVALTGSRAFAQAPAGEAQATALLDSIGENLLALSPESATSLGIDTSARAHLRAK